MTIVLGEKMLKNCRSLRSFRNQLWFYIMRHLKNFTSVFLKMLFQYLILNSPLNLMKIKKYTNDINKKCV